MGSVTPLKSNSYQLARPGPKPKRVTKVHPCRRPLISAPFLLSVLLMSSVGPLETWLG